MRDFLDLIISPSIVFFTGFLGLMLMYWVTVILGAIDMDMLDFDLDIDADLDVDVDVDVDVDADTDVEIGAGAPVWMEVLTFFNIGKVPFMLFLSILSMSLWGIAIAIHQLIGPTGWAQAGWLTANFVGSLFITKFATWPLGNLHKKLDSRSLTKRELVGKICEITVQVDPDSPGQAELEVEGEFFLLHVYSKDSDSLRKGDKALLVEYQPGSEQFLITKFEV
ncbi:OB-fold-containig protein [Pontibacter sp. G13]|uniref:OB-fold-containig protein n=1 Tax=Pontibacter sp. G13 TaxID=3074898 RepID=UPI00288C330F|nr:OB-fold-containig protein [Pontibacter sp. G13]WNJ19792.1 DUF1449 family protein [Pontibacter sp. G13]